MTLRQFLETKQITSIEVIDDLVINIFYDEEVYGLSIDMSRIENGTQLTRTEDFIITESSLVYNLIEYNLDLIELL